MQYHIRIKRLTALVIILCFIIAAASPVFSSIGISFLTFYVDDDNTTGPWDGTYDHPFQYIQDAIDHAITGDIIYVLSGTYDEHITIDKGITLDGYSYPSSIINGTHMDSAIEITADYVTVSHLTIQNAGKHGIRLEADHANIYQNYIQYNHYSGISVSGYGDGANYNKIHLNTIRNNGRTGIRTYYSNHTAIFSNIIKNNGDEGIQAYETGHEKIFKNTIRNNTKSGIEQRYCTDTYIVNNIVTGTRERSGWGTGIYLESFVDSYCIDNTVTENTGVGIILQDYSSNSIVANNYVASNIAGRGIGAWGGTNCSIIGNNVTNQSSSGIQVSGFNGTIYGNIINRNFYGITLGSDEGTIYSITRNTIRDNSYIGIRASRRSEGGHVYHNNFINNSYNNAYAFEDTAILWDNGYPSGGNFWDNYTGEDIDGDGIGDTSKSIPGGSHEDRFPLMDPKPVLMELLIDVRFAFVEGEEFDVRITSSDGPVPGATINFSGDLYLTNHTGGATLTAPSLEFGLGEYLWITVEKQEFIFNGTFIYVYDNYEDAPQLEINAPEYVVVGEEFEVFVSAEGQPVKHATVSFNEEMTITNMQGYATLTAPFIDQDEEMEIYAERSGHWPGNTTITILINPPPKHHLNITAPATVDELTAFSITITTVEEGVPVENVQVEFVDVIKLTDAQGSADFTAPSVTEHTDYLITAHHEDYISDSTVISVINLANIASIELISPNGNESLSGMHSVEWAITTSVSLENCAISLQYQYAYGLWNTFVENRKNIADPVLWNTTTVPDGFPYLVKVTLKKDADQDGIYETVIDEDESDTPFAIDNSITHLGWVHGFVNSQNGNGTNPVAGAVVCIILSDIHNVITSKCAITSEFGEYTIPIRAGTYTISASKRGYVTAITTNVSVWTNSTTHQNFTLPHGDATDVVFIIDQNRESIVEAIQLYKVGAELSIQKGDEHHILIYDSVDINLLTITSQQVQFRIDGDEESTGKTIILNIDDETFDPTNEIIIEYDGERIDLADDIIDVLNPNDDGVHTEYIITTGSTGTQILISIPHFSEHEITIFSIEEAVEVIGGITAIALYFVFCVIILIAAIVHIKFMWKK